MGVLEIISYAFSALFLCVTLSYYILLLTRDKFHNWQPPKTANLTVIIPAHNEERYVTDCIQSVLNAEFSGNKHIIVINDGSKDNTAQIIAKFPVTSFNLPHQGKAKSLNFALAKVSTEYVGIVDADSIIAKDALMQAMKPFANPKVAAACATVKVKNRGNLLGMWLHLEQLYNSLLRVLYARLNVNIVTPGPLSLYRTTALKNIGGFSYDGFSEDVDVSLRLIKAGHRVEVAQYAFAETVMPQHPKWFYRQRSRFARGWINIFKRHLSFKKEALLIYTLPLALLSYLQAVIMGAINLYKIGSGYYEYFLSQGTIISWAVGKFFLEWLSAWGFIRWTISVIADIPDVSLGAIVAVLAGILVYPLYAIAIFRYDRHVSFLHLIAIAFLFPFWLIIMAIYMLSTAEILRKKQVNLWTKDSRDG